MNELDRIGTFLMDLPVYLANGRLVIWLRLFFDRGFSDHQAWLRRKL